MRSAKPIIYLFDIDGTLVSTGGVGRRALEAAFFQRYGQCGQFDFPFDGMTDKTIVAMALASAKDEAQRLIAAQPAIAAKPIEEPADDNLQDEINAVLDLYTLALADEAREHAHSFVVHEGAAAVLDALQSDSSPHARVVGLGTGNIRKGAEIKLGAVGLYTRFRFGGFGCDHHDRAKLLAVGAQRGAALLGRTLLECDVLVIGDTPKDVAAARAIGARSLAVATGRYSEKELRDAGADHTAPTLASTEALRVLLPT